MLKIFSVLTLVCNQLLVISGNYEPTQSLSEDVIVEMGQSVIVNNGERSFRIDQKPNGLCKPWPLFGFKFVDNPSDDKLPMCPPPNIPPLIARSFKNVSVEVGQEINFNVVFTGYPKPYITFLKSDIPLRTSERIKLSDSLIIANTSLEDSGVYTMVAQNNIGIDRINFLVQVLPPLYVTPLTVTPINVSGVTGPPIQQNNCPPKIQSLNQSLIPFNDSIRLDWNRVETPNVQYKVELYLNSTKAWRWLATVPENSILIRSVKCYLLYKFRVITTANGCDSEPVESPQSITVQSGVPEDIQSPITIFELQANSMMIGWNPPINNCGSPVFEYSVEKQYFNSSEWKPIGKTTGNSTQFIDTDTEGVYRYAVKAINSFGESVPFISTYITPAKLLKCPVNLKQTIDVFGVTRDSLHLKWEKFIHDKNGNHTFQVEKSESDSQIWEQMGNTSDFGIFVTQLKCYTEYRFRVKVFTPGCETVTVESKPIKTSGAPDPPLRPIYVDVDGLKINISWALPPTACDAPNIGYTVEKQYNTSKEWQLLGKTVENTFQDVSIGQTYRYRVTSTNKFGDSVPLISRYITLLEIIPKKICPQGLAEVVEVTRDSVHLNWDQSILEKVGSYSFQIDKIQLGKANIWETIAMTSNYQIIINELQCMTEYRFLVKVLSPPECKNVTLESNPIRTLGTPEGPLRPIKVTVYDREKLDMKWVASPSVCDAPVTGYIVEKQYNSSDAKWYSVANTSEPGLQEIYKYGTTFRYRLRSINKYNKSIALVSRFLSPHELLEKCPEKTETKMEVISITRDTVQLTWDHCIPQKNERSIYQVNIWDSGSNAWKTIGRTTNYKVVINQLICRTEYRFKVDVLTPGCQTVILESVSIAISGLPEPPPPGINATVSSHQKMDIVWKLPPVVCQAPIEGYTIEKQYENSEEWHSLGKTVQNHLQDTETLETFRYKIKSINKYGESQPLVSKYLNPHQILKESEMKLKVLKD